MKYLQSYFLVPNLESIISLRSFDSISREVTSKIRVYMLSVVFANEISLLLDPVSQLALKLKNV